MRYRVTSPLTIGPGTLLGLTEGQAAPRTHALVAQGGGQYLTTTHVQFKTGEVIDCEGELPKSQADQADELVDPLADPALAASKRSRKARAKATQPDQGDLVGSSHQP